ncbi:ABC transporter substrate-binding protein [Saccharothrix luteola]|uniref:ABC transporter substrate-binding protein n=1 Tax=Saccharothrix luteola TaxID=2893018 RepID=UPI001E580BF0|nr:ABC transporter substrate-binding protein [Saccharothrix luteola]MCC8249787.1 ABC transporter substrate-binding protein [Saccharothrix luteola]
MRVLLWAAVLAAAACTPPQAPGVVVTYAATAKPVHLSPLAPYRAGDTTVLTLLQDTLLVADQSGGYIPRLAESWAVSDDGTTYTFTLRRGQRWSDGEPFTAQDVVFTFNLFADPVVRSPQASRLSGVLGYQEFRRGTADALAGVTAVGADRVVVVLAEPDAGFLAVIGASMLLFILPKHVLERIDPAAVAHDPWWLRQDVGMGPFVLAEFEPDQRLVARRNPHFRTPVSFDRMHLAFVTPEVAAGQLGTGEVDVAPLSPLDARYVEELPGVRVERADAPGFNRIAVNLRKPYLTDVRVRRAMIHAMDRSGMLKAALDGHGSVRNSAFMTDWAVPDGLNAYPHDPAEARRLLAEAGWDPSRELLVPYDPAQAERVVVLDILGENLRQVGIRTKRVPDPKPDALRTGEWDLFLFGGGAYSIDPATAGPILTCDQSYPRGGNIAGFCDPRFDALMRQGAATDVREERAGAYRAAALIENAEVPYLWTARPRVLVGVGERVRGFVPRGDLSLSLLDVAQWNVS